MFPKKFRYYIEVMDCSDSKERTNVEIKEKNLDDHIFSFDPKPKTKSNSFFKNLKESPLKKIPP